MVYCIDEDVIHVVVPKRIGQDHLNINLIESFESVPFSLVEVYHPIGIETAMMSTGHSTDTSGVEVCLRVVLLAHRTMLMTGFTLSPQPTLD